MKLAWKVDGRSSASAELRRAAEAAVADAAEYLLEESNRTAPIEEGTLVRSATATADGLRGAVAWDTPYAVRQHEDLTFRHDSGRRAKWAEQTFREQAKSVGVFIADRIRKTTG